MVGQWKEGKKGIESNIGGMFQIRGTMGPLRKLRARFFKGSVPYLRAGRV